MALRPWLNLPLVAALLASACTHAHGPGTDTPALTAPATIADLDDYSAARNAFALQAIDDPARAETRAKLRTYLLGYVDHAVADKKLEAASAGLEQLAGLWLARELRALQPDPELAAVAERAYQAAAASGRERHALLAVGLMQAFGEGPRKAEAEAAYAQIAEWLGRNAEFATDPGAMVELDRLLEDITAQLPTPFLVDALAGVYLTRYRDAQQHGGLSASRDPRIPFTGYLLARLYLRADDLEAAVVVLDRLEVDAPTKALRQLIADADAASRDGRSPADLDQLTYEFIPDPSSRLPDEILHQSWGIVDNLARRTLARFPDHPPAHLARGRVLRAQAYTDAAIVHYERAFAGKSRASDREDLHRAWSELSELYQLALDQRSGAEAEAAAKMLERVEDFHVRAAATWPQRPIQPSVDLAWMTVALAEFNAGRVERAEALMTKTLALEVRPAALSLLATIAMRRGDFEAARTGLGRLEALAERLPDQLERYDWLTTAKLDLAENEALAGQPEASVEALRAGLRELNTLLSYPGLADSIRAEFALRRARVFFYLDEIELGMRDAREARQLAPERNDTLSDPLIFMVSHAHFDQALELLGAALDDDEVGELGVYFSLWVVDLAARLERPVPELAQAYLRTYADDDAGIPWQRKLARSGLGELSESDLIAAATDSRERSEAYFYSGLMAGRGGDQKASLGLMRKVLGEQMMGDFEYEMAQSYLIWNELPRTARAPL